MKKSYQLKLGIFFFFLFCLMPFAPTMVNAASVWDGFECRQGQIYQSGGDGNSRGQCVDRGNGKWEACPTANVLAKYNIKEIQKRVTFEYNANNKTYNLVMKNMQGLIVQRTNRLMSNTATAPKYTPDASGTIRINGVGIGTDLTLVVTIGSGECAGTSVGNILTSSPSYKINPLYSNSMCVNYRNKYSGQGLAEKLVPACYKEKIYTEYNPTEISQKITNASSILDSIIKSSSASHSGDLSCDFYKSKNRWKDSYSKDVSTSNPYWDLYCKETIVVTYDTPRALTAGDSFDWQVDVSIEKTCIPYLANEPSISSGGSTSKPSNTGGCDYYVSCASEPGVSHNENTAGPNLSFDACIKQCDGGKYSQSCVDQCYKEVYENNKKSSSREKNSSKFSVSPEKLAYQGEGGTRVGDWYLTGWDEDQCTGPYENGGMPYMVCTSPHGVDFYVTDMCDGSVLCYEYLRNGSNCGTNSDSDSSDSGDGDCEGRGDRVLDRLDDALDDLYDEMEDYLEIGRAKSIKGTIIDSYTNKDVNFTGSNGSALIVTGDSETDFHGRTGEYDTYRHSVDWECPVECPPEDDDDDDSGGGPGGGGGSHWDDSDAEHGPGVSSSNPDQKATQLGIERLSDDEGDCSESHSASRTYTLYEYSSSYSFTISLPQAYISANNGNVLYGSTLYNKLPNEVKMEYYTGKKGYYTSVFSPTINDFRNWPTYPGVTNPIGKNDPSIKKNIFEEFSVGSWGQWDIDLECFYGIINKYCVGCVEDEEEVPYCNPQTDICEPGIQYMFRPIDLANGNMFPNKRSPRWNWTESAKDLYSYLYPINPPGVIDHIQKAQYTIYQNSDADTGQNNNPELDYEIKLTKQNIRNIRSYNKTRKNYSDYDMYCRLENGKTICTSRFIGDAVSGANSSQYMQVIKRGRPGCNNEYAGECVNY